MLAGKQTPRRWRRPANVRLSTSAGGACAFTAIDVAGGQKGEALAVDAARRCRRADEAERPAKAAGKNPHPESTRRRESRCASRAQRTLPDSAAFSITL